MIPEPPVIPVQHMVPYSEPVGDSQENKHQIFDQNFGSENQSFRENKQEPQNQSQEALLEKDQISVN